METNENKITFARKQLSRVTRDVHEYFKKSVPLHVTFFVVIVRGLKWSKGI